MVNKRDRQTLVTIIRHEVEIGTTIHSDCWPAYHGLSSLGYNHSMVNHSENFVDPITLTNIQRIKAIWTRLRLKIIKQMKSSPLLESHLAEHWYRLYYKPDDLFNTFLGHVKIKFSRNPLQTIN